MAKVLRRRFHDSSDGHVYSVFYNTSDGSYTEIDETLGVEHYVSSSSRHVCGNIW